MKQRTGWLECSVGLFVLAAFAGLIYLGLQVSGLTPTSNKQDYTVAASFHDIGSLRPRARVTIAGMTIGHVSDISLVSDNDDFRTRVTMKLDNSLIGKLGTDSSVMIQTQGLLGDQYLAIQPIRLDDATIPNGGEIKDVQDAIVLEKLIQQVVSSLTSGASKGGSAATGSAQQ
ncbi:MULTISPECIES: outer membrane lipid asymmetry maintenance protein MlaD [unclassified Zymobacter]|uniref:outer membrane lipid asymmetry maintenance protein MlaD n=1 Tax=unclassified Zymobacter TaxID=3048685 RepID=UPI0039C419B9